MIRKIRDILRPPSRDGNPYGLKEGQLTKLKTLVSRPEFKEYQSLLDSLCTLLAEGLLLEHDNENLHYTRGYITGLRRAGTIVDEIINSLEQDNARRTTTDADRRRKSAERRKLATYGSRHWRARSSP